MSRERPRSGGSETDLVRNILAALTLEPLVAAWRNQTGRRAGMNFGLGVGSADIIAIVGPSGRMLALEAKVASGRQSPAQVAWARVVESVGGFYAICHSVAEARQAVQDARRR